ncbi:hypothetical protein SAMN05660976_00402 [Nonomuraea pusilla]|uniref:Ig-like domain-containing protein n=2 Tax=Nonomuraea pusilla TaxID=46177 RepID=A0A1H7GIS0_9ACTN|nr:hypothetical protein SAMN05660976_00402 [Nonomuraea pusilla]
MMSVGLARRAAAFGASAVLATMAAGLVSSPAQAATSATAGKTTTSAASAASKSKLSVSAPKASTGDYEGGCPVKVNFTSTIKVPVKGKTELAYRWLHGDGSKGKVQVVKLKGHGTKSVKVSESITFKGNVKGWEAIQVLGPKKVTSKKGYFSVACVDNDMSGVHNDKDLTVSARAWADPASYAGPCTPNNGIDFVGLIETSRPAWVRYRWVLNGEVVDGGKVKVWSKRKVGFDISPRHSQRGWAQLEILGPDRTSSNRAYYKVWCKDSQPAPAAKVSVSNLVTATNHDTCKVGAHASVSTTGASRVQWTWQVNGTSVLKGETVFSEAGTKTVALPEQALAGEAAKGGKITLTVTGQVNSDTITQSYAACQAKVTVSSVSVAGQRNDMCKDGRGPGVDFKATLHSTAPTTVKYYWVVNGVKDVNVLERQVNGDLDVTWGVGGTQSAKETKGTIELVVVSPNAVSSGVANYSATCPASADA